MVGRQQSVQGFHPRLLTLLTFFSIVTLFPEWAVWKLVKNAFLDYHQLERCRHDWSTMFSCTVIWLEVHCGRVIPDEVSRPSHIISSPWHSMHIHTSMCRVSVDLLASPPIPRGTSQCVCCLQYHAYSACLVFSCQPGQRQSDADFFPPPLLVETLAATVTGIQISNIHVPPNHGCDLHPPSLFQRDVIIL